MSSVLLNQSRKVKNKESKNRFTVSEIVNTKMYHNKFEQSPFPKPVCEALYRYSLENLNQRNGTTIETAYAIDARIGRFIVTNEAFKSGFNTKQKEIIDHYKNPIIIVHNHPLNGRLSFRDIRVLYSYANCLALFAIGHNGELHYCLKNMDINFTEVEIYYKKAYNEYTNRYDKIMSKALALDDIYKFFDL